MTWFTSDHHFGHKNIIDFDNRPFRSLADHDATLVDLWNDTVKPNDHVWYLGDFAMGKYSQDRMLLANLIDRLNGFIHFVGGNHDGPLRKFFHMDDCFDVLNNPANIVSLDLRDRAVVRYNVKEAKYLRNDTSLYEDVANKYHIELGHYPLRSRDTPPQTMKASIRIHGHTHRVEQYIHYMGTHHLNVAVNANDYRPVAINTLMARYKAAIANN